MSLAQRFSHEKFRLNARDSSPLFANVHEMIERVKGLYGWVWTFSRSESTPSTNKQRVDIYLHKELRAIASWLPLRPGFDIRQRDSDSSDVFLTTHDAHRP